MDNFFYFASYENIVFLQCKCPERMSELGMQSDEIEIRILPKAFFSQCLKNSCLLQSVVSMFIFLKLLKRWLPIESVQNKWVDFLAIFLTHLVFFFFWLNPLRYIPFNLQFEPIFGQTRSVSQSLTSVVLTDRKRTAQILRAKTLRVLRQS